VRLILFGGQILRLRGATHRSAQDDREGLPRQVRDGKILGILYFVLVNRGCLVYSRGEIISRRWEEMLDLKAKGRKSR
jgi:hypothetical protein